MLNGAPCEELQPQWYAFFHYMDEIYSRFGKRHNKSIILDSIFSFKCVLNFLPKIENQETAMYCYVLYAILFIFPG